MEGTFGQIVTVVEKRAAAKTSIYSWVLEQGLLPSLPPCSHLPSEMRINNSAAWSWDWFGWLINLDEQVKSRHI